MDLQDMTDLIFVRDAYKAMNKSLHGEEMAFGFHEGYLGAMGRIFRVIEQNMPEKWRQDDNNAIRILDAISLHPEERARLLLADGKSRIGEEVLMGKYKFQKELKEAVLYGQINGEASILIDGVEEKARCHAMRKIVANGMPCLVSESNNGKALKYTVEAISFENKGKERNWVCVRLVLIERAVEYFLENHQLESILGDYNHVIRMTTAAAGKCRPDFQVDNTWIEMRILRGGARESQRAGGSLSVAIRQIEKYCRQLSAMKEPDKRMILLLICQSDRDERQIKFKEIANGEVRKAIENGVEIWTAEMRIDAAGISLLSCQNILES